MRSFLIVFFLTCALNARTGVAEDVSRLEATGHDSRIDLRWEPVEMPGLAGYNVYRSSDADGPFDRLNIAPHETHRRPAR